MNVLVFLWSSLGLCMSLIRLPFLLIEHDFFNWPDFSSESNLMMPSCLFVLHELQNTVMTVLYFLSSSLIFVHGRTCFFLRERLCTLSNNLSVLHGLWKSWVVNILIFLTSLGLIFVLGKAFFPVLKDAFVTSFQTSPICDAKVCSCLAWESSRTSFPGLRFVSGRTCGRLTNHFSQWPCQVIVLSFTMIHYRIHQYACFGFLSCPSLRDFFSVRFGWVQSGLLFVHWQDFSKVIFVYGNQEVYTVIIEELGVSTEQCSASNLHLSPGQHHWNTCT